MGPVAKGLKYRHSFETECGSCVLRFAAAASLRHVFLWLQQLYQTFIDYDIRFYIYQVLKV